MKYKIDTSIHFFQYIIGIIIVIATSLLLLFNIYRKDTNGIIASSIFLIYGVFLHKKVFYKPKMISFDDDFLYSELLTEPIKLKNIISIEKGKIIYQLNGENQKLKLPNFYFLNKNYKRLKIIVKNEITTG